MKDTFGKDIKRVCVDLPLETHKILMELSMHTPINTVINDAILLKYLSDNIKGNDNHKDLTLP